MNTAPAPWVPLCPRQSEGVRRAEGRHSRPGCGPCRAHSDFPTTSHHTALQPLIPDPTFQRPALERRALGKGGGVPGGRSVDAAVAGGGGLMGGRFGAIMMPWYNPTLHPILKWSSGNVWCTVTSGPADCLAPTCTLDAGCRGRLQKCTAPPPQLSTTLHPPYVDFWIAFGPSGFRLLKRGYCHELGPPCHELGPPGL